MSMNHFFRFLILFLIFLFTVSQPTYSQESNWTETINDARETYQRGDPQTAINRLTTLVRLGSELGTIDKKDLAEMRYLLAKIYFETQEFQKSTENLNRVFDLAPDFETDETNKEFKKRVSEVKTSSQGRTETLDLEIIEAQKSLDNMTISAGTSFHSEKGLICNPQAMSPREGYIYVKMSAALLNQTINDITFDFKELKMINESGKEALLLYLATFDDGEKCYTNLNINPPTIKAKSKTNIELLAIAEEDCPGIRLRYRDSSAVIVDVKSLSITTEEAKATSEEVVVKTKTIIIGQELSVDHKGKELTVYLQRIIPGKKNTYLGSTYFEELPEDLKQQAQEQGYHQGDVVKISLGEEKGSMKILPAE
jgi:tetratricopeptide (TPR) repeat protein